ncbi:MAG: DUF4469 domain-containing protein [Treponema sp.]|nr:DUF4469 domain-containing protein [Treponema sp.]
MRKSCSLFQRGGLKFIAAADRGSADIGAFAIKGDDPSCRVYFINARTSGRIKVDAPDIVENKGAQLLIITPAPGAGSCIYIEVTAQFTN